LYVEVALGCPFISPLFKWEVPLQDIRSSLEKRTWGDLITACEEFKVKHNCLELLIRDTLLLEIGRESSSLPITHYLLVQHYLWWLRKAKVPFSQFDQPLT